MPLERAQRKWAAAHALPAPAPESRVPMIDLPSVIVFPFFNASLILFLALFLLLLLLLVVVVVVAKGFLKV
jgi:hypothetical protein